VALISIITTNNDLLYVTFNIVFIFILKLWACNQTVVGLISARGEVSQKISVSCPWARNFAWICFKRNYSHKWIL